MTVALAAMQSPASKRLPAPVLHPTPSHPASKHRARKCTPLRVTMRSQRLYRVLTAAIFVATLVFAFFHYWRYGWQMPAPVDLGLQGSVGNAHRMARRFLRLYQRQLHLHPLLSRAITAGIIFFVADVAAQLLIRREGKPGTPAFSVARLCRYSGYGLLFMGPFLYLWYAIMNEYGPEDDLKGSLLKCVFEQLTLEPICISMYIIYDGLVCRKGVRVVRSSLDSQFFPLWFKNAVFWLPANFANYYIGTPDLRVVFANLCSLFWNIYFSAKVNKIGVPLLPADKGAGKYLPVSNHERDAVVTGVSSSHQSATEANARYPMQTHSAPRVTAKTLVV